MSDWTSFTNGDWSDAGRWTGGIPNASGAVATFSTASSAAATALIALNGLFRVGTLNLVGSATARWALIPDSAGNGTLVFNGGGGAPANLVVDTNGHTAATEIVGSRMGFLLNVILETDTNVTTQSSDTLFRISSVISGTGRLTKYGTGLLELTGVNTYSGGTTLRSGTVDINSSSALGTGELTFDGGTLRSGFGGTFANSIDIATGTGSRGTWQAEVATTLTIDSLVFTNRGGSGSSFSLGNAVDSGTIVLSASLIFNAPGAAYNLNGGTVRFGDAYNAANFFSFEGTGVVQIATPATLDTGGFAAIVSNIDFDGGTVTSTGGALNLAVLFTLPSNSHAGIVAGTGQADSITFDILDNAANFTLSLGSLTFSSWTDGVDIIGLLGSVNADTLTGSNRNDTIIAGDGADIVNAGSGNDAIFGEGGNDNIGAGAGIDYVVGGSGGDAINGDTDADEIYGEAGDDTLTGGPSFHTDILVGGDGNDTIDGDSGAGDFDFLYGNLGDDAFRVDTPADLVFEQPGEGIDTVIADISGAGFYLFDNIENLTLVGATPFGVGNVLPNVMTGNDIGNFLLGGGGADRLNGGLGNDVLFGEAGNDTFVFQLGTGADVIGDFVRGQDKIDVSAYGLTFPQLQSLFVQNGNVGAIQMTNGDVVILHNITMSQLTASDFILVPAGEAPPKAAAPIDLMALSLTIDSPFGDEGLTRWLAEYHSGSVIP